jgi:hypothetical protein
MKPASRMANDRQPPGRTLLRPCVRWVRRRGREAHRLITVGLMTALLILVNLLAIRLNVNWRLPGPRPALSQRARTMMASTRGKVAVTVLLPRSHKEFEPVRQLLANLRDAGQEARGAQLSIEYVDPHRDLARAAQLARAYGVTGWAVVFACEGRVEKIGLDEMIETVAPTEDPLFATAPRRTRFRGEQLCVTALARLARPQTPIIYALSGQGERDFENYDLLGGYTDFAREIRREGYDLRKLVLSGAGNVPDDCDVLLVAGPRRPPATEVRAAIETYLARGGRLFFLADRAREIPHGWEGVLERLGLKFANLTAVGARTLGGFNLIVDRFSPHPIARELEKNAVYFVNPQVIDVLATEDTAATDRLRADVVVAAPDGAWGETDPDRRPRRFDAGVDRQGRLPLVVAVELGAGLGADVGLRPMRAVVFGDSHVAVNAVLSGGRTGNRDLLLNAINWLAESGLPSAPSLVAEGNVLRLGMTRRRQIRFFLHSAVYWPLLVAALGFLRVSIRRRQES